MVRARPKVRFFPAAPFYVPFRIEAPGLAGLFNIGLDAGLDAGGKGAQQVNDNGNGKENRTKKIVLGVLAGALGIIAIKLLFKWVNGEI